MPGLLRAAFPVAALVLATMAAGIALAGAAGAWFVAGLWHLALAGTGLAFARRWTRLRLVPLAFALPGVVYSELAASAA